MELNTLTLILTAIFAPAIFGGAGLFLPRRAVTVRVLLTLLGMAVSVGSLLTVGVQPGVAASVPFVPSLNMELSFVSDGLGLFFALLVSGIGALIVLYARGYFGRDEDSLFRFYPTLGLFATAMIGIVLSDNFLGMFLFWELTSVSSFLLIGWERENRKALLLAVQAFIVTGLGGLFLLGGLLVMGAATGAWNFTELAVAFGGDGVITRPDLIPWACLMIFVGCATKSAQWPFHFWLPGAMAAPTPVSAYLHSATMVKAGVYLIARLFPILALSVTYWAPTLIVFGGLTMLLGGYLAVRSAGLKSIFAYTTVSQLGLLVCAYGLGGVWHDGMAEPIWPVTQILNHALYKAPLFIIAGAIIHITGRKSLPELKGLWRSHRLLAVIALVAAYALAGGPMTLSFAAKEAFFYQIKHAAAEWSWVWIIGGMAVATAICNVTIFVRMTTTFFARREGDELGNHHEHGFWGACIWLPAALLVAGQVFGGFAPDAFGRIVESVETHRGGWEHLSHGGFLYAIQHPGIPLYMSLIGIGAGVAIGLSPLLRKPQTDFHNELFPSYFYGMQRLGHAVFYRFQSGNLRQYFVFVLGALVIGLVLTAFSNPEFINLPKVASMANADIGQRLASVLLTGLICGTAFIMPFTERRIVRVLMLGACGFSVTGMYLLYQAPDLALTQLMCEIIGIVLFLLVLRLLPEEGGRNVRFPLPKLPRAAFSLCVGVAMGWMVLHAGSVADQANIELAERIEAQSHGPGLEHVGYAPDDPSQVQKAPVEYDRLGPFFLDHAYDGSGLTAGRGGGGTNVVNVILVDFRGYDTLGEITVLGITLMGILSLLSSVPPTRIRGADPTVCYVGAQPQLRSVLLHTAMRLVLPLALVFAGYMFFKGHNEPGGGFISGLIAAVGLGVYRMTEGFDALKRIVPIRPAHLAVVGLGIALGAGLVVPLLAEATGVTEDAAFLRSWHGYIPLFGGGSYHLTSAAFFDLGVFLVVVGAAVGILNRLEEELE